MGEEVAAYMLDSFPDSNGTLGVDLASKTLCQTCQDHAEYAGEGRTEWCNNWELMVEQIRVETNGLWQTSARIGVLATGFRIVLFPGRKGGCVKSLSSGAPLSTSNQFLRTIF